MPGVGLVWDLLAKDNASPAFLRVAGAADKAAASTAKASLSMQASIAKAGAAGASLTKKLTLPIVALGAVATAQAVKYQKSMTLIQTAGGETAAKAEAISKGILNVAKATGTGLDALSDGIYTVAKAGSQKWSAAGQLQVLKAAAQGAKAENVDLGTAVNALTSVMMSYHLGTSQAVAVQNELIVGAGRAKTTMQDYAASLATVVPVASAAGVKFDQIAGAIATLTQHGTSAAEATQELAFTIRNLQAPNNVAVSAMNQLGISSVNVSRNLGKRGLTGTLQFIESHLPKTGLVYLSTMKRMEAGTADLQTMIGKMPANLAKLSKGLLDGTVSAKDYRKAFRDLGAQGYAQGSQFLTLAARVKGFNDSLKNGTPAQKTMAAALKQIFGGAVGLNTALQLGGENMDYFKKATKEVGKAALETGSDVLGWNKTQDTLAVKMDKAKASLQVLAVEIGTKLIPVVSKIVDGVTKAVQWFDNLSGSQKKILGWSLATVAAVGPVLSIFARLSTIGRLVAGATGGMARLFSGMAGASEAGAARISTAVGRISLAMAGIGIGLGVGALTQGRSTGTKLIGVGAATLLGAGVGSAGGPLGAALGGLAAGVTALATSFMHTSDAAQIAGEKARAALLSQKNAADQLEQSLEAVGVAYDNNYKQQLAQSLTKTNIGGRNFNILALGKRAGIAPQSILDQVIGTGTPKALDMMNKALREAMISGQLSEPEWDAVSTALGLVGGQAAKAERNLELQDEAMGKGRVPANLLGISLKKLTAATKGTGTALAANSAAGLYNRKVIDQNIDRIERSIAVQLAHHKSIKVVTASFETQINTLHDNLIALGFNEKAVDNIIGSYTRIPKSVATQLIKRGVLPADIQAIVDKYNLIPPVKNTRVSVVDRASAALLVIKRHLDQVNGKTVVINTAYSTSGGGFNVQGGAGVRARAAGGIVNGPGTGTSDSILARLSNGEFVVNARATRANRPLLESINKTPGFASGGPVAPAGRTVVIEKQELHIHYPLPGPVQEALPQLLRVSALQLGR